MWNQQVQTDKTIPNNKPDIIIRDNEAGTRMLIDVAISGDRNVIKKETEKILKYKDVTIEIRGLLEKYPTFGRKKETGLLGALDT